MSFFHLFCLISCSCQQGDDTVAEVALDDYLAVLDGAADTASGFEGLAKGFQVGGSADEIVDHGNSLAATTAALHADVQFLLLGGEGLGLFRFVGGEDEVGVCRFRYQAGLQRPAQS